ncbi:TPA: PTS sugar transporter subunit IIA [Aeromonas hydrophila]|uniref:PTS galactosamine/N-acetylgalactosamine transporter subunit IIA n=1 Tax=Aeromonas hydrophila TaxID=644 RepID=UPI000C34676A|nr:PTS galactosamine/N-acetylgalactosamine transporter subunit IIA [Aeromonas hydrophila]MBQ4677989.1 PTS mannose transporter subunit IIA [Aeromonas hydrophila]MBW3815131.1 PTS mannose transporter subunit IIA [Aeromonas hydrophila]MCF7676889.1 PTS sugar transporter subunit IIA [Aeromonas hydrophila]MCF7694254.1 PTS sugar transporter subunit IIA [Aeromonas hydrophila]MCF7775711.1 PTS sugar transporter subunit IIA [Aeromonas hydrophila]
MIGIVVSGHINFASGMQSAMKAIVGEPEQMRFVDFVESMSTDDLETALRNAAQEVNSDDGVLFLTDIPGGSPANRASVILMDSDQVEVLSGVNLPMIANAAFERDGASLNELVDILQDIGKSTIQDMRKALEAAIVEECISEEEGL